MMFQSIRNGNLLYRTAENSEKIMADMQNAYVKLDKVSKIYQDG